MGFTESDDHVRARMSDVITYVVLAGGAGARLGLDKATVRLGGVSLLERLVGSLPIAPMVIGPEVGGGPVAAIEVACSGVTSTWIGLLAVDMPFAAPVIAHLAAMIEPTSMDGLVPLDKADRMQWLSGLYRTESLRGALRDMGETRNQSMRTLMSTLVLEPIALPDELAGLLMDIDTPRDLALAQVFAAALQGRQTGDATRRAYRVDF